MQSVEEERRGDDEQDLVDGVHGARDDVEVLERVEAAARSGLVDVPFDVFVEKEIRNRAHELQNRFRSRRGRRRAGLGCVIAASGRRVVRTRLTRASFRPAIEHQRQRKPKRARKAPELAERGGFGGEERDNENSRDDDAGDSVGNTQELGRSGVVR